MALDPSSYARSSKRLEVAHLSSRQDGVVSLLEAQGLGLTRFPVFGEFVKGFSLHVIVNGKWLIVQQFSKAHGTLNRRVIRVHNALQMF